MKIGILTFHSQLNYGGVLQCWALAKVLRDMGHIVVIVDRWMTPDNSLLNGPFRGAMFKEWCLIALKTIMGCRMGAQALRYWRTRRFVKSIGLTAYHFYDWKDAPTSLGVDCVVVGSDQVWHGGDWGYPTPEPYLLKGAPPVWAIAYAASFGMRSLPSEYDYASCLRRFSAISVRESEGVQLVKDMGFHADHVVDPTQLLTPVMLKELTVAKRKSGQLVCYFIKEDLKDVMPLLVVYAEKYRCVVKVLTKEGRALRACPRTVGQLVRRMMELVHPPKVKVCVGYGPKEFARTFAESSACITDSFHALMFSCLYNVNCRFLRPRIENRRVMFSRVEEFVDNFVAGPCITDDVKAALSSISSNPPITYRKTKLAEARDCSLSWLRCALSSHK